MNEKGRRALPHVFWEAFPGQQAAFRFLREQGLKFSERNYGNAFQDLLDRYGADTLGTVIDEQVKSRLHPDDLNDLWRQYWAEELPTIETIRRATLTVTVPGLKSSSTPKAIGGTRWSKTGPALRTSIPNTWETRRQPSGKGRLSEWVSYIGVPREEH
jgi:hypothetical protein